LVLPRILKEGKFLPASVGGVGKNRRFVPIKSKIKVEAQKQLLEKIKNYLARRNT